MNLHIVHMNLFCITRGFPGTRMRVTQGIVVFDILALSDSSISLRRLFNETMTSLAARTPNCLNFSFHQLVKRLVFENKNTPSKRI